MMSDREISDQLVAAINRSGVAEVVEVMNGLNEVNIMYRVQKRGERDWVHKAIKAILLRTDGIADVGVFKQFFLRDGKLRFGWVLAIGGERYAQACKIAADIIDANAAPVRPSSLPDKQPLIGQKRVANGGPKSGRAGAAPVAAGD